LPVPDFKNITTIAITIALDEPQSGCELMFSPLTFVSPQRLQKEIYQ